MKLKFNTCGNDKQKQAVRAWLNPEKRRIFYGGTKGCGKTNTGVNLIFGDAFIYPETYYFIAREQLNDLRKFTIPSILEVFNFWQIPISYYKYNGQDNFFELYNGSRIYLIEASYMPSDPLFQRFGSYQFTRGWIEEAGQLSKNAVDNLIISTGRWNNNKYNLPAKTLETFNPSKNYLYQIRKMWEKGTLPKDWEYIQALTKDNKTMPGYYDLLEKTLSQADKERLLYDNWDFDNDPNLLINSDAINDLFYNDYIPETSNPNETYLSLDLAMRGRDRTIGGLWFGFYCDLINGLDQEISTGKSIEEDAKELIITHSIPRSHIIADSDGLGAYLESYIEGIKTFHGGSTASNSKYFNLKSECAFLLAKFINERKIKIKCNDRQQERIRRELGVLKEENVFNDDKLKNKRIISKYEMKSLLGFSPDYLDMLIMRMYFEVIKNPEITEDTMKVINKRNDYSKIFGNIEVDYSDIFDNNKNNDYSKIFG